MHRCATYWLSRVTRTHDVVRAPFPSLPACPSLSVGVRLWVGSEGRGAFLSHYCPLGRLETWRRLHRESKKHRHARLPGNTGGGGRAETPTHPHRPSRTNHSRHAPRLPSCPALGISERRQASPAADWWHRGRGGVGQRAADSRWRRPGGGYRPSEQRARVRRQPPPDCVRSWLGWWRALDSSLRSPHQGSGRSRRYHLPSLFRPPPFCAAAPVHLLPSPSRPPRGPPGR